jgi:hypothetical protein
MDGLGVECRQGLASERTLDPADDLSMISVEPANFAGKQSEFLGFAIMDGRWRSDMHFGRPTMFRVPAGEHTVTVHIKRRFRAVGYRGRAIVSLPVVVEPGEHLDLVFGVTGEWKAGERGRRDWNILLLSFLVLYASSLGAAFGAGWLAFPILRDAVAWATLALGIGQPWLSFAYFFVSSRQRTAVFTMLAWVLFALIWCARHVPTRARHGGSPYFLSRRPDYQRAAPIAKAPYVDPFA